MSPLLLAQSRSELSKHAVLPSLQTGSGTEAGYSSFPRRSGGTGRRAGGHGGTHGSPMSPVLVAQKPEFRLDKSAVLPSLGGGYEARARLVLLPRRSGGTGRRAGLKIRWGSRPVWVRLPPSALTARRAVSPERLSSRSPIPDWVVQPTRRSAGNSGRSGPRLSLC